MVLAKYTTLEFTEKAQNVHGDLYDYSLVDYVHSHTKVTIVCLKHGNFTQVPSAHLNGRGCAKCGHKRKGGKNRSSTADFTKKARAVHGNLYDYSLVDYVDTLTKVRIICSQHGEFGQTPGIHFVGSGCPQCGAIKRDNALSSNSQEFIGKAKSVHGDLYDYFLAEYLTSKKRVKIICSVHGEFEQKPNAHLAGHGCPKCSIKNRSGVNHPLWNFLTSDEERLYGRNFHHPTVERWRTDVFDRDHYTCQKCHEPGRLNAHHILPWSKHLNERFAVDNGITLCEPCHRRYHSVYGKGVKCDRASMNAYLASNLVREVALSV